MIQRQAVPLVDYRYYPKVWHCSWINKRTDLARGEWAIILADLTHRYNAWATELLIGGLAKRMYEYVHGGDIYTARDLTGTQDIIDFSANINPLGLPSGVKNAVKAALNECLSYPDPFCRELAAALALYEKTDQENIYCANGTSEIIFRLTLALKPKKALILAPTFADYEKALRTVGCDIEYYILTAENDFSLQQDYIGKIKSGMDMLWICNPNNPTGQGCKNSFLVKVLERCRQTKTVVLIDECFMDFVGQPEIYSVQSLIGSYNNLLVLKAFTKIYAMPGIRLGYVLTSNRRIIEQLRLAGQDWSVSTLAQKAGISALNQKEYLQKTKILVKKEREYLIKELTVFGFKVYGSLANYIFFEASRYLDLDKMLLAKGILIRSCSNYAGLNSGYFRVAVRNHSDNQQLIAALKDVTKY